MKKEIFNINNLTLSYDKKNKIIKNITLSIKDGEFISIIGPNGSGKSTLLRSMAKILKQDSGIIKYDSKFIYKSWKYVLLNIIFKLYKLPLKSVILENDFYIDLQNKSKYKDDKLKSIKHFNLSKMYLKAMDKEFIDNDIFILRNKINKKSIFFTKEIIKIGITLNEDCSANYIFNEIIKNIDINSLTYKKLIELKNKLKKENLDNIFYFKNYKKNIIANKNFNTCKNKKIIINQDIVFNKEQNFYIENYWNNNYIKYKLNKFFRFARMLGFKIGDKLCMFEKIYFSSKEYSKNVAFVPQITNFPSEITVEEFVWMGRYPHMKFIQNRNFHEKKVIESIKSVNLWELKDKYMDELSGGQKQRAIIALALAQDTKTILLDEPTNHLDIKHQLEIIHLLHHLNHNMRKTIVLVIHDINHGMKFSDRIIIMNKGEIAAYGKTNDVISEEKIKEVFGVDAHVILSQNKKIISDYWIKELDPLSEYGD